MGTDGHRLKLDYQAGRIADMGILVGIIPFSNALSAHHQGNVVGVLLDSEALIHKTVNEIQVTEDSNSRGLFRHNCNRLVQQLKAQYDLESGSINGFPIIPNTNA